MLLHKNYRFNLFLVALLAALITVFLLLFWSMPLQAQEPTINNWHGEYDNILTLSDTPALVRDDQNIDFVWG